MLSAVPCCGGARGASVSWHPTGTGASWGQPWGTDHCSSHSSMLPTLSEDAKSCAFQVSPPVPEAEAGGMCHGVRSSQGSKGQPSGLPEPQPVMAAGPEDQGAGGFPASSFGGHKKRRTDTYPGSSQTDFFLLLKISIPQWGCCHDRGLFIFMLTTSWFPVPLAH